jgi:hypothetical protein
MFTDRSLTTYRMYCDETNRASECSRHLEQAHATLNALVARDDYPPFVHSALVQIRKEVMDAKWALAVPDTQEEDDE